MTSDHSTEEFLQLEQTASQIVEELNQLKSETLHYSDSTKSLQESLKINTRLGNELSTASSELATLSGKISAEFSEIANALIKVQSNYTMLRNVIFAGIVINVILLISVLAIGINSR